jgi:hypothetical protein
MDNADDPLNLEREATAYLQSIFNVASEKKWIANFLAGSVWSTDRAGVASGASASEFIQWSDYTNSAPVVDIKKFKRTVKALTGKTPNVLVLTQDVWDTLTEHPDILDRIKYSSNNSNPAVVSRNAVAAIMELDRIEITSTIETTSAEKDADSGYTSDFLATKKAGLYYVPPAAGLLVAAAGYQFAWRGSKDTAPGVLKGFRMKDFYMQPEDTWRYEMDWWIDMKKVEADLGLYMSEVIA